MLLSRRADYLSVLEPPHFDYLMTPTLDNTTLVVSGFAWTHDAFGGKKVYKYRQPKNIVSMRELSVTEKGVNGLKYVVKWWREINRQT